MTREELLKIAKPILFNTEMAKAILDDRKTATRRLFKPYPPNDIQCPLGYCTDGDKKDIGKFAFGSHESGGKMVFYKPPCKKGDILYVRETWNHYVHDVVGGSQKGYHEEGYFYKASPEMKSSLPSFVEYHWGEKWKPSIHMPKEAARIFLKVNDVRVERLQGITPEQAVREGTREQFPPLAVDEFRDIWNSTIKKSDFARYGWDANPYVWVIEFERIKPDTEV